MKEVSSLVREVSDSIVLLVMVTVILAGYLGVALVVVGAMR